MNERKKKMKVRNIINKNGNAVPNQFIIKGGEYYATFQSYDSTVAIFSGHGLELGKNWDYSNTTMRHLYNFFQEYQIPLHNSKEVRKAIKDGFFTYPNGIKIPVTYDSELC